MTWLFRMSFYTVLNVDPECSLSEIKQAYKELARVHHPDKATGQSDELFKQIAIAYATLRAGRSCHVLTDSFRRHRKKV